MNYVQNLIDYYTENGSPKGELVLVIDRADTQTTDLTPEQLDALILKTVQTSSAKETAELIAGLTGLSKKQIYKRVVELKNG